MNNHNFSGFTNDELKWIQDWAQASYTIYGNLQAKAIADKCSRLLNPIVLCSAVDLNWNNEIMLGSYDE